VNQLQISPDKHLIVAAGNPTLRLYDIASGSANAMTTYDGHTNNVTAVGFQKVAAARAALLPDLLLSARPLPTRAGGQVDVFRLGGRHDQDLGPARARLPA